jgi:LmbE family N-acetylglucosaminyl deacetylase
MDYRRIMVFAAHADDEITMAGTMARLASEGVRVVVVQMTDGCEGYPRPEMRETIVALRREEADACNQVLGVARRVMLQRPDMGLEPDKETLQECIRVIREERPQAIFTHGPVDRHRDHRATHAVSVEARWHAGEPVAAALGPSYYPPHLYYYKGVTGVLPRIEFDVSGFAHKRYEALATQVSQHVLFQATKEELLARAREVQSAGGRHVENFWFAEWNTFHDFPPAAAE